jgi:Domain of unknown function (DUF4442)
MLKAIKKRNMRLYMNIWPPFAGAGIRVVRLDADWRAIDVEMKMRFWNANYVGTHYGGSLYSMTDPFYMLMLIENLGREYIVWDKAATIRFRKPGTGKMRTEFRLTSEKIDGIREALKTEWKVEPVFMVEIWDESGNVIAEVEKTLHVRKKDGK